MSEVDFSAANARHGCRVVHLRSHDTHRNSPLAHPRPQRQVTPHLYLRLPRALSPFPSLCIASASRARSLTCGSIVRDQ
jgi:hypothetical protein